MVDTVKEVLCYREKDEMQTKRASLAEKESDSPLPNYLSHITPYQPQQSLRDYWGWGKTELTIMMNEADTAVASHP